MAQLKLRGEPVHPIIPFEYDGKTLVAEFASLTPDVGCGVRHWVVIVEKFTDNCLAAVSTDKGLSYKDIPESEAKALGKYALETIKHLQGGGIDG